MSGIDPSTSFELFGALPAFLDKSNDADRIGVRLESAMGALSAVSGSDGAGSLALSSGMIARFRAFTSGSW